MKTKQEILEMSKLELEKYKWSKEIITNENKSCSDCSGCSYCSDCSRCSDCSSCYLCRNVKGLKYAICNVELTKEEYETKMKELELL